MPPAPTPATCTEPAAVSPAAGGLTLDSSFACDRLHAQVVPVRCCLLRQAASRRSVTRDTWRGTSPTFPTCTASCAQGAAIRAKVPGADLVNWRGAGPGQRFDRGRSGAEGQAEARRLRRLTGLLDLVPSIDAPPNGDWEPTPVTRPLDITALDI